MKRQLPVTKVNRPRAAVPRINRKRRTGYRIRVKRLILLIVLLGIIGYVIYILITQPMTVDPVETPEQSRNVLLAREPERKAVHEKSAPIHSVIERSRNAQQETRNS